MTELVHYDVADGVATITLDSPHNRNALSSQLVCELFAGLDRAEDDDAVKVVLLRSADRVFCSGADLSEATGEGMEEGARTIVELQRRIVASPSRSWSGWTVRSVPAASASSRPPTSRSPHRARRSR